MSSSLERLEALEANVLELRSQLETMDVTSNPMFQMLAEKVVGIEQSMVAISKTLAAISEELIETGVLKSDGVMARLRDGQDAEQINQIKSLTEADMLEPATEVGEQSIVVVRHSLLDTETGEVKVLANYRLVSMAHPTTNQVIRSNLLGKKVKETVEGMVTQTKKDIITVKEIFSLKETQRQGEVSQDDSESLTTKPDESGDGAIFDSEAQA